MTFRDLCDWEKSIELLARQVPLWEPGRTSGYHGYTQGHLVGEVVRRVTGKTIRRFLSDEIAAPLGVAEDYYIGTPEEADSRVSLLIQGYLGCRVTPLELVAESAFEPARFQTKSGLA